MADHATGAYGSIGTTLSLEGSTGPAAGTDVTVAPSGSSYTYERTFELNRETQDALAAGTVVRSSPAHGCRPLSTHEQQCSGSPPPPYRGGGAPLPAFDLLRYGRGTVRERAHRLIVALPGGADTAVHTF